MPGVFYCGTCEVEIVKPEETSPAPASSIISWSASEFPWWLVALLGIIGAMGLTIVLNVEYQEAFLRIIPGLALTFGVTIAAFVASLALGLIIGLGRIAKPRDGAGFFRRVLVTFIRNAATLYIEFVRGIPVIVFMFAVAFVLAPDFADLINVESRAITQAYRGAAALALFYAAFIAEVIRAGIQSVPVGQIEAGKAVGLHGRQILRQITLPQAVRNMLPALGNDLISLMKDTSLLSVLAVRELTQQARLYSGSTFRFRESFFILMVIYVALTLILSLLLRWYENKISVPGT